MWKFLPIIARYLLTAKWSSLFFRALRNVGPIAIRWDIYSMVSTWLYTGDLSLKGTISGSSWRFITKMLRGCDEKFSSRYSDLSQNNFMNFMIRDGYPLIGPVQMDNSVKAEFEIQLCNLAIRDGASEQAFAQSCKLFSEFEPLFRAGSLKAGVIVRITSAARGKIFNDRKGGGVNSMHLSGNAFDIQALAMDRNTTQLWTAELFGAMDDVNEKRGSPFRLVFGDARHSTHIHCEPYVKFD